MVDEVVIEEQSAKRQKTENNVEDDNDVIIEEPEEVKQLDPYEANLKQEEDEVSRRSESQDTKLFVELCGNIQELMKDINNLKNSQSDDWKTELEEKKSQVLMLVLSLRRLSRVQKVRVKNCREGSGEARQDVDNTTLQLQNLLYEVAHLKKEIKRCLDFHSGDHSIQLIDVDSFKNKAPPEIYSPDEVGNDEHKLHLARLNYELEERKLKNKLHEKLTSQKNAVAKNISEHESKLASLVPQVNSILEATQPLQESLGLKMDEAIEVKKIASYLPTPLYTLYVQLTAYAEVIDKSLKYEIKGSIDKAQKFAEELNKEAMKMDKSEDNSGPLGKKKLFTLHPLSIVFSVSDKNGNKVNLTLSYATTLRVVTVSCNVDIVEKIKYQIEGLLNKESFLNCFLENDNGLVCPNPIGNYLLQSEKFKLRDSLSSFGKPYQWAQMLCGLTFINTDTDGMEVDSTSNMDSTTTRPPRVKEHSSSELSGEHVHLIVTKIKDRIKHRLLLHTQCTNLLNSTKTSFNGIEISSSLLKANFPSKIKSTLNSWRPISWNDYCSYSCTEALRDSKTVTQSCLLYKAMVEHGEVYLDVFVGLSPDHPNVAPAFSINLYLKSDESKTPSYSHQTRQIESELNVHYAEMLKKDGDKLYLLPLQLYRMLACLDSFVKEMNTQNDNDENEEEKQDGDLRCKDVDYPFKYNSKSGTFSIR